MATKTEAIIRKGKTVITDWAAFENLHVYKDVTFDSKVVTAENLKDIENFHVRHDDIFISTTPRSGKFG